MVLVTLGGCHLLDGLVAFDSVEARKEIVRCSGEEIVRGYNAHPAGIAKSNSSGLLVAWGIPILRVDVRHSLRVWLWIAN